MSNKLLSTYLLPYYVGALVSATIAAGSAEHAYKQAKLEQARTSINADEIGANDNLYLLAGLLCFLCLSASAFLGIVIPAHSRYISRRLTKKYILGVMRDHPDMKKYMAVLDNKQALTYVMDSICNHLTNDERKQILNCVAEYDKTQDKSCTNKIINIVKNHNSDNKHFLYDLYNFVMRADLIYLAPNKQNIK